MRAIVHGESLQQFAIDVVALLIGVALNIASRAIARTNRRTDRPHFAQYHACARIRSTAGGRAVRDVGGSGRTQRAWSRGSGPDAGTARVNGRGCTGGR
jgi:hypothetical protein